MDVDLAHRGDYSLCKMVTQRIIRARSVTSAYDRGDDLTMLYLILPNGTMKSAPATDDVLRDVAAGVDVTRFDWSDLDQRSDSIITGLALRYGMKNPDGISAQRDLRAVGQAPGRARRGPRERVGHHGRVLRARSAHAGS